MILNGAEILVKLLEEENVLYIAGIPGGFNLPIYDALYKSKMKHILARHEQGAAFIAQGISRSSNKIGVCIATSGPGATNLLTAIADAKLDSIPLIAITGQVPLSSIGTDAFQEVDAYGLTIPITKHNFLVRNINDLFTIIPEAFKIALEGRCGPVLIDIPKNIQTDTLEIESFPPKKVIHDNKNNDSSSKDFNLNNITSNICGNIEHKVNINKQTLKHSTIECIAELINNSRKPIIYAGGGIIRSNSSHKLYEIAKKSNIPVALSLMGLSAFPYDDDLNLGMLGMHGAPYTNYLLNESDLILALGVRFDDRATGNINTFCPKASIIHVDIDPSEINKVKSTSLSLACNVFDFLTDIMPLINENKRELWIERIKCFKNKYPLPSYKDPLHPANIIPFIGNNVPNDTIISTDVGEHQMWTAQRYPFKMPKTFLTSGGLGTMGFGLPCAIGAAIANKDKCVLCFSGDGSILMNLQELATLKDLNLNVKVIIFSNHTLGLVHQQQKLFYKQHYMASKFLSAPDFKLIAQGFGLNSYDLSKEKSPLDKLKEILATGGPVIINLEVDSNEDILPMVAPGQSNLKMIGCDFSD